MKRKKLTDRHVIEGLLPHLMRYLVVKGTVTESLVGTPSRLNTIFRRHLKEACEKFSMLIALHEDFAATAYELWDRGDRHQAVVLFATAVEQALNTHYRHALLYRGFTSDEITTIIRSQNLDAKLSWLLKIATSAKLDRKIAIRLRIIFEIRNSIVHYKAVPGHPDRGDDSLDAIKRRFGDLGRISLRRDFGRLCKLLDEALIALDPSFLLANEAARTLLKHWDERHT